LIDALKTHLIAAAFWSSAVYGVFWYVNRTVPDRVRTSIALWMLGNESHPRWADQIPAVFNGIFGPDAFSWKALRSTAAMTLIFGIGLHLAIFVVYPYLFEWVHKVANEFVNVALKAHAASPAAFPGVNWQTVQKSIPIMNALFEAYSTRMVSVDGWLCLILALIFYNVPVDYLAILKTRWMLKFAFQDSESVSYLSWLMIADVIITMILLCYSSEKLVGWMGDLVLPVLQKDIVRIDPGGVISVDRNAVLSGKIFIHQAAVSAVLPFIHTMWLSTCVLMAFLTKAVVFAARKIPVLARYVSEERLDKEPITLIGEVTAALVFVSDLLI
jgi:hypothetical protein